MASIFAPIQKIWNQLTRRGQTGSLQGSQYPVQMNRGRSRSTILEVPIRPIRPVLNNLDYSFELLEVASWSYEARHAISCITRDIFQQQDGRVASWSIAPQTDDDDNEIPLNPDVLAIGNSLKERFNGKQQLFGGNALQRAAREMLFYGDCFLEIGFEKEGLKSGDWGIAKTLYLPTFHTFVEEDEEANIACYWQRRSIRPTQDDIRIEPFKVLHFMYEQQNLYGQALTFQSLEIWRKLKEVSADLEEASRAVGVSPWLHIMPEDKDERYKADYRQEYEQLLNDGIVTNLYLMNGADVKKASSGDTNLTDIMEYWLDLRRQMIPPGLPAWLFPGLAKEDRGAGDLQGQPSMAYARFIAATRGILGEQIKWAINLEIILKKGYDWWLENGKFDITWGEWTSSTFELAMKSLQEDDQPPGKAEDPEKQADRLIRDASLILQAPMEGDLPQIKNLIYLIRYALTIERVSYKKHQRLESILTELECQKTILGASTNGQKAYS